MASRCISAFVLAATSSSSTTIGVLFFVAAPPPPQNLEVVPSGKYYFNADIQGDDEVGYTLSNGFLRTKVAYVRSQDGVPQSASAWVNAGTFTMKPIAEMPYELYDAPRP
mmetsp:Transcript_26116/g.43401  ORF Transcript_26116/g.43401 Transcript_26116/m.43401 type:complete len:110 (-) Transcript_26116:461-790(-)